MEHIKNIEIKNFKSIRHAEIKDCRRVNVFIGEPNVGKSNILEGLSLFSVDRDKISLNDFVRIGNKSTTLFHDGKIRESSQIIVNGNVRMNLLYEKNGVSILFEGDRKGKGFDSIDLELELMKKRNSNAERISVLMPFASFFIQEMDRQVVNYTGNNIINIYDEGLEEMLNAIPKRRIPVYKYQFRKEMTYEKGSAWHLLHPFGGNLFEIISTNEEIRNSIINIFKKYELKFLYDTEIQEYKILKFIGDEIFTIPYSMIADTLQRLFFYQAAISSNEESVLLFEEPEAHMFPPYISKFTSDMVSDENNNQYFFATHSPYVLNNLISDLDDTELAIYLVSYKKDTGETVIDKMSKEEMHEAYQFGYDFFMNLENFIPQA